MNKHEMRMNESTRAELKRKCKGSLIKNTNLRRHKLKTAKMECQILLKPWNSRIDFFSYKLKVDNLSPRDKVFFINPLGMLTGEEVRKQAKRMMNGLQYAHHLV